MSCENVQKLISPLLDRKVPAGQREKALAHIESCRSCGEYLESMQNLRAALRGMSHPPMPADLASRLRVTASHERARQTARASFASRWSALSAGARLWFDNLMRPVALPVSGGILSALVLFSLLVPSLSFSHNFRDQALYTDPDGEVIVLGPAGTYLAASIIDGIFPGDAKEFESIPRIERWDALSPSNANVVWLTVDENGKVSDYALAQGRLTPDLQSIIMFSQFKPATFLGVPVAAKVKVVQRIPVRGMRS
jgi:hypothetical protein